jgi:hypothetical protein
MNRIHSDSFKESGLRLVLIGVLVIALVSCSLGTAIAGDADGVGAIKKKAKEYVTVGSELDENGQAPLSGVAPVANYRDSTYEKAQHWYGCLCMRVVGSWLRMVFATR